MDAGLIRLDALAAHAIRGRPAQRGFSLVELAIATLLIAMFMTMGLSALNVQQENASAGTTQKNLDAIKDALVNYLRTNSHLPCPSDFQDQESGSTLLAGEERRTTTVSGVPAKTTDCDARLVGTSLPPYQSSYGIVPYRALGLTRDTALDGWGDFFSYQVSFISTSTSPNSNDWTRKRVFLSTGNAGGLTIMDRNSSNALYDLTTTAVVVILSHGRNGLGAYTTKATRISLPDSSSAADEYANTPYNTITDVTYVKRTRTDNESATGGSFDDYVMYLSDADLLTQLVKDSTLKWADRTVSDNFDSIKVAVLGYAMASINYSVSTSRYYRGTDCTNADTNATTPPYCRLLPSSLAALSLSSSVSTDPWGNSYQFSLGNASLAIGGSGSGIGSANISICPTTGTAYTLTSYGSDGAAGGTGNAADISLSVGCADLRSSLGTTKIP